MPDLINKIVTQFFRLTQFIPDWFIGLFARIAVATVFWRSAQTKISGGELLGQKWQFWNFAESTFMLFEYEYAVPLLPVKLAAYMATFAEFFLSLALILGVLTRFSALGLLAMTAVIQFFVYPDAWTVHILWAAILVYLLKHGGGSLSIDNLIMKRSRDAFDARI